MEKYIQRIKRDLKYFPQKKLYVYEELEKHTPKIYVSVNTNKQISTLYKSYIKNPELLRNYYYSLLIMLSKFYNIEDYDIVKLLKKKDDIIYKTLNNNKNPKKYKYFLGFINAQIRKCILSNYKIKNFLDVGCGGGLKTAATGKYLGLKKKNIHCLNLYDDKKFDNRLLTNDVLLKTYREDQDFPYKDNYFSLLSADMVFHHVNDLEKIIKECYRVLKKGGLLLIREHDARTDFDKILCDIQHMYYMDIKNYKDIEKTGNYMSWLELNYKITNNNFILKKYFKDTVYKNSLENVTRTYFSLYMKN